MKNRILFKDTIQEIKTTFNRFISIFAIIALGTGFFAGIKSTCPDMLESAQVYFSSYNLMDAQIKSTMGFAEKDIEAFQTLDYVSKVQPGYTADVFVSTSDETDIVRMYSFDKEAYENDDSYINKLWLQEGRFPQKDNECVIDNGIMSKGRYKIGDTIKVSVDENSEVSDYLNYDTFTIVGFTNSVQYISFERGKSNIGNGTVSSFMFVPEGAFSYEVYTDIFLNFSDTTNLSFDTEEYKQTVSEHISQLENFAKKREEIRYNEIIKEANDKIRKAENELAENEENAYSQIYSAEQEIESNAQQLEDKRKEVLNELNKAEEQINLYQTQLDDSKRDLNSSYEQINQSLDGIPLTEGVQNAFDELRESVKNYPNAKDEAEDILKCIFMQIPQKEEYSDILIKAGNLSQELAKAGIADSSQQALIIKASVMLGVLDQSSEQLDKAQAEIDAQKEEFSRQKSTALAQLNEAAEQISSGRNELSAQKNNLANQFSEARAEINNAKEEISGIEKPKWYVFDRTYNPGYESYKEDAERVDKISAVFPVFFILVAMLVCLTTMTRMVEEQRTQIGTLKALGYSKGQILFKYLFYAGAASVSGSAFGLCIGFKLFPIVIFKAYQIMYVMPDIAAPFKWDYALGCTAVALLATCAAAFSVCYKTLYETPASLMRPKAPEAGKKVLIEKIGILWNKLSFLHKVTARNIFRYKKRVLMTVVGIAGCTALMLTGFGLRYAITAIVDLQYDNIFNYDLLGVFESNLPDNDIQEFQDILNNSKYVKSNLLVGQKSVSISTDDVSLKREVYMLIPTDNNKFGEYISLRKRTDKTPVELNDNGVVVVEKVAKLYDLKVGDELKIYTDDYNYAKIPVSGIVENYTLNYVYMTPSCYEKYFNEKADINAFLVNMNDASEDSELSTELLQNKNILALSYASEGGGRFRDIISSLTYIVLVIILCAGALAFVVLYNLANINMMERRRELATIKVLGFYDNEVADYINRENVISSVIGIIAGLFLGVPLEKFVIAHAEVDSVMFVPTIPLSCFIYSIVLTFAFVLVVNGVISQKLKKIDMVESLKSTE